MAISPVLPEDCKNFLIDIDGTICEDIPNEEPERMATAECYDGVVEQINIWYDQGHQICFFTARAEEHRAVTGLQAMVSRGTPVCLANHAEAITTGQTTTLFGRLGSILR